MSFHNISSLALVLDLCIHIIEAIGDINVDLLKIFVWHSYFLYKLEDLFMVSSKLFRSHTAIIRSPNCLL